MNVIGFERIAKPFRRSGSGNRLRRNGEMQRRERIGMLSMAIVRGWLSHNMA
jgi:hypothetical protein